VHQTAREEASTFWSGCGAIRREIFFEMGGFEKSYQRASIEDIELGYRLRRAGHRIRLLKDLQVKHLKRWEAFSLLKADFVYRALPWTEIILEEGRFLNDLNIKPSQRLSVICTFLMLSMGLGAIWFPWLLVPTAGCILGLFAINRDLYQFLKHKRGVLFAIKSIPWHWAYFFYSGLAFAFGFGRHQIKKIRSA
jgi:hypothetical protein